MSQREPAKKRDGGKPYSAEDDAKLRLMWAYGASMGDIGKAIGRSRCSIAGRILRLNLARKIDLHKPRAIHNKYRDKPAPKPEPVIEPRRDAYINKRGVALIKLKFMDEQETK